MGESEYGKSGHFIIMTFLKHLMMLLVSNFFQGSFLHCIIDDDSM